MLLRDQLFNDPTMLFNGCAVCIPVIIAIVYLAGWMITDEIDVIAGTAGIILALAVMVVAIKPPDPRVPYILLAGSIMTLIFFPIIRNALRSRDMHLIDLEGIERAYEKLEERPANAALKFKIAQLAYQKGIQGHSLRVAEEALKGLPERLFSDEHKTVRRWQAMGLPHAAFRPLACPECGFMNEAGEIYCQRCGARFLLDLARGSFIGKNTAKKLLALWLGLMLALIGIPVAVVVLPPVPAVVVVTLVLVAAVWIVFVGFLGEKKRAPA